MVSISNWKLWAGGAWTSAQTEPLAYAVGIESSNYDTKKRTCVKISLSSIGSALKRSTLTLQLNLLIAYYTPNIGTEKTIRADLSTAAPSNSTWGTQGTVVDFATASIDHTKLGATSSIKLTFDMSKFEDPNKERDVYIYIYGLHANDAGTQYQYKINSGSISEKTVSAVSAVTTGTITSSTGQIFLPNGKVTVNWTAGKDGTSNKIASYTAYLRVGSAPTASDYTMIKTGISSSSTSHTFTLSGVTRGKEIWVGIQAIGANSNYSGAVATSKVGIINSLPGAPTVKASGASLTYTNPITYTVTAGTDSNSNQSTTLYYSIGSGTKNKITDGSLTISLSSSFKHGSNTLKFYAYDGLEYSSASSHEFTADFSPIIKSGTPKCVHTNIKNMNNLVALTTSSKISFSMSGGSASGVTVKVRQGTSKSLSGDGSTLGSSYYSYNSSTKTITIDITKIPTSVIGYGNYFEFSFTVTDGSYTSSPSGWLGEGRRPKLPNKPTLGTCTTDTNTTTANSYFKKTISVNWSNPLADAGCPAISSTQLIATYGSSTAPFTITRSPYSLELSSLSTGTKVTLKIKVTDLLGNSATSDGSITFIKTDSIAFVTQATSVVPTTYRPLTSESATLEFVHPKAKSQGGNITYAYFIQIGSNKEILDSSLYSVTTQGEQRTLNISNSQKKNLATLLARAAGGSNNIYTASFIVTATDGYEDSVSLSKNFKVEFREAPAFSQGDNFSLIHDYVIGRTLNNTIPDKTYDVPGYTTNSSQEDKDIIMFNPKEGLIFKIPKASDPNNDISKYQIFISRNDLPSDGTISPVSSVTFETKVWLEIAIANFSPIQDNKFYYYRFNTSVYSKNQYFYFKVRAVDAQGNVSDFKICDDCIIGCRSTQTQFSVSNLTLSNLEDQINLGYSLKITDLGGSATKDGWNQKFYETFPNYERKLVEDEYGFEPAIYLHVDISNEPNFDDGTFIRNSSIHGISSLFNPTRLNITFEKDEGNKNIWSNITNASKVYVRFKINTSNGVYYDANNKTIKQNFVYGSWQSKTIFMTVPTVAHRVNAVGINTKTIQSNEVLVIENFQEKKYIVLKGSHDSEEGKIIINLANGTISGATIDCGTWL